MSEYQDKTTNAKVAKLKKLNELKKVSSQLNNKQHKELLASIATLQANISTLEASLSANGSAYTESQRDLTENFKTLREILENGLNVTNIKDIKQAKEIIVSNLKDIPKPVVNTTKTEIPKWLASEKSVKTLNNSVMKVVQALIDLEANIKPSQDPDEFVPFRRVIRSGNRLVFDDTDWTSRGGGGGGSSDGLTDAQLRATPVDVTLTSGDIEIGAVELKNGTDDTRATVTAGNALKVDGSAVTQPVSGTVTATPSGTQNVDVTANTIGLATSANQLPDGHNVTVDNGAGASAVNIQDGGNSITVDGTVAATQSGTWTEANSTAIKTAVEIIDNAISGNEMQVDVITMPTVTTTEAVPSAIYNGKTTVTTAGTRVVLAASQAVKSVTIKALATNTGLIYVGSNAVASTNGFQLSAGETISMDIANLNTVNLDSAVNGEGVTYIGVN